MNHPKQLKMRRLVQILICLLFLSTVPGKPSSNKRTMDAGVSLGRSGSFGHSNLEMSKRIFVDEACKLYLFSCTKPGKSNSLQLPSMS